MKKPPDISRIKITRNRMRTWIRALRSGDYEQGTGALCRPGRSYCCLGVLLDTIDSDAWIPASGDSTVLSWSFVTGPHHTEHVVTSLPAELVHQLSDYGISEARLITLNDTDGDPFTAIADHIEARLRTYEKHARELRNATPA